MLDVQAGEISDNSGHSVQRFDSTSSPLGEEERKQIDVATKARREKGKKILTNGQTMNGRMVKWIDWQDEHGEKNLTTYRIR